MGTSTDTHPLRMVPFRATKYAPGSVLTAGKLMMSLVLYPLILTFTLSKSCKPKNRHQQHVCCSCRYNDDQNVCRGYPQAEQRDPEKNTQLPGIPFAHASRSDCCDRVLTPLSRHWPEERLGRRGSQHRTGPLRLVQLRPDPMATRSQHDAVFTLPARMPAVRKQSSLHPQPLCPVRDRHYTRSVRPGSANVRCESRINSQSSARSKCLRHSLLTGGPQLLSLSVTVCLIHNLLFETPATKHAYEPNRVRSAKCPQCLRSLFCRIADHCAVHFSSPAGSEDSSIGYQE